MTTYVYLVLIFAEIIPIFCKGISFHLVNPVIAFLITFAVFFNDSVLEAAFMWVIEAMLAITCEFLVYRFQAIEFISRTRGTD